MNTFLVNAFSLNMLSSPAGLFSIDPISTQQAKDLLKNGFVSAVGHADTAAIISNLLDIEVLANRVQVSANASDTIVVAQYIGPRLPEGATQLPEGAQMAFFQVKQVQPVVVVHGDDLSWVSTFVVDGSELNIESPNLADNVYKAPRIPSLIIKKDLTGVTVID